MCGAKMGKVDNKDRWEPRTSTYLAQSTHQKAKYLAAMREESLISFLDGILRRAFTFLERDSMNKVDNIVGVHNQKLLFTCARYAREQGCSIDQFVNLALQCYTEALEDSHLVEEQKQKTDEAPLIGDTLLVKILKVCETHSLPPERFVQDTLENALGIWESKKI